MFATTKSSPALHFCILYFAVCARQCPFSVFHLCIFPRKQIFFFLVAAIVSIYKLMVQQPKGIHVMSIFLFFEGMIIVYRPSHKCVVFDSSFCSKFINPHTHTHTIIHTQKTCAGWVLVVNLLLLLLLVMVANCMLEVVERS